MEKLDRVLVFIGVLALIVGLVVIAVKLDALWRITRLGLGLSPIDLLGIVVVGLILFGVTKELFR